MRGSGGGCGSLSGSAQEIGRRSRERWRRYGREERDRERVRVGRVVGSAWDREVRWAGAAVKDGLAGPKRPGGLGSLPSHDSLAEKD